MKLHIQILVVAILTCACLAHARAASVSIESRNGGNQGELDALAAKVNSGPIHILGRLDDLARGFADATVAAGQAGSMRSFSNYKTAAVGLGYLTAYRVPKFGDNHDKIIEDEFIDKGDAYAGLSAGLTWIDFGLNCGFILDGLYLGVKYGGTNGRSDFKGEEGYLDLQLVGFSAQYRLFDPKKIWSDAVDWRGITLSAGLIYHRMEIQYRCDLGQTYTSDLLKYQWDGVFTNTVTARTYSVPVEAVTSIGFLWILNASIGAGIDFNFGSTDLTLAAHPATDLVGNEVGKIFIKGSDVMGKSPTAIDPKLMLGVGFNLGPVKVDMPFTVYPLNPGWSMGLTVGIVMDFLADDDGKSESSVEKKEAPKETAPPLTDKTPER